MVLWTIMKREMVRLASRRIYLFMMVIAPVCCFLFFADLFKEGVPTNLPIAVVDKDNTSTSRSLTRSLDAFGQTEIVMRTGDFQKPGRRCKRRNIRYILYSRKFPAGSFFRKRAGIVVLYQRFLYSSRFSDIQRYAFTGCTG